MTDPHHELITATVQLTGHLPAGTVHTLAQTLATVAPGDWVGMRQGSYQVVPQPALRALVDDYLTLWREHAPGVAPAEAALMLRTAAVSVRNTREGRKVELVWTGPAVSNIAMRRTDQALLEVIAKAKQRLLIVSFTVYKIPAIADALVKAAKSGVQIRICVEAPEPSGQKIAYDTIKALGSEVAQHAAIYVWPSDKRPTDGAGHNGVLHAKCAVADEHLLFISSANLTDHALNLNIELGALISGGAEPTIVVTQFDRLIAEGVLRRSHEI